MTTERTPGAGILDTREFITIGPFAIFFTNVNTEMGLPGHSHHATVSISFETLGSFGFPAFEDTYAVITEALRQATTGPFRNATNEEVARRLWELIEATIAEERAAGQESPIGKRGGDYRLALLDLNVRGVLDKIGHADGWTAYTIRRREPRPGHWERIDGAMTFVPNAGA